MTNILTEQNQRLTRYILPALFAGGIAWLIFTIPFETPLSRATGLALAIVGVALLLRRMGSVLAIIGALTLAFSPAFQAQTGGGEGDPATIVLAGVAAVISIGLAIFVTKRPWMAYGAGIIIFTGLFWSQIGTERSLRLTGFVVSWLMYLLVDILLLTNPHPDEAPPLLKHKEKEGHPVRPYHTYGILLLFGAGVLNDPLLVLLFPALILGFFLINIPLPRWYMAILGLIILIGIRGIYVDYLVNLPWLFDISQWRDGSRWLEMINFVVAQFTIPGIALSILGLARLSRWYPPLGTVTLIAYGAYFLFGLVYEGNDRATLLLPLLIIQITWMTYAVFAISEWLRKSTTSSAVALRGLTFLLYALLPLSFVL